MTKRPPSLTAVGVAILATLAAAALLAPLLSPYDPRGISGEPVEAPSAQHLLGTNDIGQDIFSQLVSGARASLLVGVLAAALAIAAGVVVGTGAGIAGGVLNTVIMRVVDLFLAVPLLPLLVLVAALAGPGRTTVILTIGLLAWPDTARIVHSQARSVRQRGFVRAAFGFGSGRFYVMRRHLFPNLGPLIVANLVGIAMVLDAGLAFLGLGDPTGVSWGAVLSRALAYRGLYSSLLWTWWVLPVGMILTVAVLGFTFVGVGLEPRTNPRWRQAL